MRDGVSLPQLLELRQTLRLEHACSFIALVGYLTTADIRERERERIIDGDETMDTPSELELFELTYKYLICLAHQIKYQLHRIAVVMDGV